MDAERKKRKADEAAAQALKKAKAERGPGFLPQEVVCSLFLLH